jgi:uncharacterized protein (TIGR02444 family)
MTQSESMASAAGSPFWRFSLRFYRQPAVEAACLTLQDEAGADVNVLLFLLWCATLQRRLSATEIGDLNRDCEAWGRAAVIPLRELRRALKTPPPLIAAPEAEVFRSKIKAVELEAERLQQDAMYQRMQSAQLGEEVQSPTAAAAANIAAYQTVKTAKRFPEPAVKIVLAALAAVCEHKDE